MPQPPENDAPETIPDPTPERVPEPVYAPEPAPLSAGPEPGPREDGTFPYATWSPWTAIGAAVTSIIAGILIALPFIALNGDPDGDLGLAAMIAVQVCTAVGFLVVPFMLSQASGGGVRAALGRLGFKAFSVPVAAKWIGLGILAYMVWSALYAAIVGAPEQDDIAGDFGPIGVQILLIALLAPVAEEVCFRSMLFGGIRTRLPLWAAALAAGAVFGLLHFSTGWSAVPSLAVLGAIFAVVYEKTGSIWPPIIMHAMNNGFALAVINS